MSRWLRHFSALVLASGAMLPAQSPNQAGPADFTIFLRGQRIGAEHVDVSRTADGWTISATGNSGPPINFVFDTFTASYAQNWDARSLRITGQLRGQPMSLNTKFVDNEALSEVVQAGLQSTLTHRVSTSAVILPNNFYSAYEALALRLQTSAVGDTIPVYVAPQAELAVRVERMAPRRISTPGTEYNLRQFDVTFPNPAGPVNIEIWIDARGRLARVAIPAASVAVVRDDLSTVMARLDKFTHPRDQEVFIPANGFNLAATITPPEASADRAPVVILLSGSGAQDRDETVAGIPILGQVAGRLSDAGFFVVRYDKRGVGQSGGRIESTSLQAYAEDALAVVRWARKRRDVDRDRLALVGHSEGGAVALLAADKNNGDIDGIALLAAPGTTGRDVTLAQQRHALDRSSESESLKQQKIALQNTIVSAVMSGRGWEKVPPELRQQADTPWFKSWLAYDAALAMRKTNQPVLILQGALDSQVPHSHADALEALANRRVRTVPPTTKIVVPGVNHLLVPAKTGEIEEYANLSDRNVSPAISDALTTWLRELFAKAK